MAVLVSSEAMGVGVEAVKIEALARVAELANSSLSHLGHTMPRFAHIKALVLYFPVTKLSHCQWPIDGKLLIYQTPPGNTDGKASWLVCSASLFRAGSFSSPRKYQGDGGGIRLEAPIQACVGYPYPDAFNTYVSDEYPPFLNVASEWAD